MNGAPFTIRERTPEDDAQIVAIFNASNPDRSPARIEGYRHNLATIPPEAGLHVLVAERDGQVVAVVGWNERLYSTERHSYRINLSVHPAHRVLGIGSALYSLAIDDMQSRGARRVFVDIREDEERSDQFARARGFTPTGFGDRGSRLHVRSANLERSRRATARVGEGGIVIRSMAELDPDEEMLRAICDADNASAASIPSSEEWKDMPFDQWKVFVLEAPGYAANAFFVALDGDRPIGLCFLELKPANTALNGYTGVHPDYRGRGIARALKLRVVEWAQENSIEYIFTGNDVNNTPMLAINTELGYEPMVGSVEMMKHL